MFVDGWGSGSRHLWQGKSHHQRICTPYKDILDNYFYNIRILWFNEIMAGYANTRELMTDCEALRCTSRLPLGSLGPQTFWCWSPSYPAFISESSQNGPNLYMRDIMMKFVSICLLLDKVQRIVHEVRHCTFFIVVDAALPKTYGNNHANIFSHS